MENKTITYSIKNNDDWSNLKDNEPLVEINNDAYFGFRAMERNAISIAYDPNIIDSLIRLGKESRKFPNVIHTLILDVDTLGFESSKSEEDFMKCSSRIIEELIQLNPEVKLDFIINSNGLNDDLIIETLYKIYKK